MFGDIKVKDLSYKEIFNTSFKLYLMNIKALTILTVLVYVPVLLLENFVIAQSIRDLLMLLEVYNDSASGDLNSLAVMQLLLLADIANAPMELITGIMRTTYIILAATVISATVFMPLIASGSTYLALENVESRQGRTDNMMSASLANIFKTFITTILSLACLVMIFMLVVPGIYLAGMIGAILFAMPGIYLMICFTFAVPAVITTGKWGFGALRESFNVVRGRWFRTLALIMLSNAFVFVFMQLISFIRNIVYLFLGHNIIIGSIISIAGSIFLTYFVVVECLWFINKHFMLEENV